jgi:aminoglycoside phosphotransferase (APT) family kinase protein
MREGGATAIAAGEAHGMRALLAHQVPVQAHAFTWHDTGNPAALQQARLAYQEPNAPHILEKANEAIWFVGDEVIKFSDDKSFIFNRVKRAQELAGFVPPVTGATEHMYRYRKVQGQVMSEVATVPLFEKLLERAQAFWNSAHSAPRDATAFRSTCRRFYQDKTLERVQLFYKTCQRADGNESINGVAMPTLDSLLNRLDWAWLADGLPGRFHGDFHFENILWDQSTQSFTFLDWRQDFGGTLGVGDVYYDLAKLLHGLIVSHALIEAQHFSIEWGPKAIRYDLHRTQMLVECERRFAPWLQAHGYDRKKVWVLTALVYLNIAALHHHPYSLLLFALGKKMLHEELET